jgi:hypothetical protein
MPLCNQSREKPVGLMFALYYYGTEIWIKKNLDATEFQVHKYKGTVRKAS